MSLVYRLLYALRFTPWDRDEPVPELVEAVDGLAPGRALDLGCGTGAQSVFLAQRGWEVTAVDIIPRALAAARQRAQAAGVRVDVRHGDVARMQELGLSDVALAFDRGCFHGLPDDAREGYARGVGAVTGPGAVLILMAFQPPTPAGLPRGATRDELERRFGPDWKLGAAGPAQEVPRNRRIQRARPTWYRFERG
jgi:SAM-dependent methyltransferase